MKWSKEKIEKMIQGLEEQDVPNKSTKWDYIIEWGKKQKKLAEIAESNEYYNRKLLLTTKNPEEAEKILSYWAVCDLLKTGLELLDVANCFMDLEIDTGPIWKEAFNELKNKSITSNKQDARPD
jgi:hypothetical protein